MTYFKLQYKMILQNTSITNPYQIQDPSNNTPEKNPKTKF